MTAEPSTGYLRAANAGDIAQLLGLSAQLFDEGDAAPQGQWRSHAPEWFARYVDDAANARFPVIEVDGELVSTAIGTLELGVPNPQCVKGRSVRLANVTPCLSTVATDAERGWSATSSTGPGVSLPTALT